MRRMVFLVPLLIITMLAVAMPASAAAPPFGNDAFRRVWERQDRPVAEQISGRSWTWGPTPNTPAMREPLVEGFEGMRVVQYFDKSRMEINDPTANPFSPWYVTNGLLPIEMMTGRMQIGYNLFEWRLPARIAAIGNPDRISRPTPTSFASTRTLAPSIRTTCIVRRPVSRECMA
ncbi:MAG: hypothetical protein RMJ54_14070 [Roseiflexaceae bacterium]|nr:hypothetical protein [Roseiflexaceae bacterium]